VRHLRLPLLHIQHQLLTVLLPKSRRNLAMLGS
jgi:hypothetical protein